MNFDDKMQEIQKTFTEERVKKFAIVSPALMEQPDYIRSLYLRMLCLLVRGGDMPTEEQVLFVRRLTAGAGLKDDFTELMRQSMNMDEEGIASFIEAFSQTDLKYYFVVDGCIACTLGSGRDRFKLLAECAELLGVTKADLQYLSKAAKTIILQSTEAYDEVMRHRIPQVDISLLYHAKWFYNGALENTNECLHWYSADKRKLDLSKCNLKARNVIIENATIELTSKIRFENQGHIAFRNCTITGKNDGSILVNYIDELEISDCVISKFNAPFCNMYRVQDATLIVQRNTFRDCCHSALIEAGSILDVWLEKAIIVDNHISNCTHSQSSWVEFYTVNKLQITGNSFESCQGMRWGVYVRSKYKIPQTEIRDNHFTGSLEAICDKG